MVVHMLRWKILVPRADKTKNVVLLLRQEGSWYEVLIRIHALPIWSAKSKSLIHP